MGDKVDEASELASTAKEALAPAKGGVVARQAHLKILLHAAKHAWADTCGALIGTESKGKLTVQDAVPFFHSPMMAPMLEVGTAFVEEYCKSGQTPADTKILGWYYAPCRDNQQGVPKPTLAVANKLRLVSDTPGACLITVRTKDLAKEDASGLEIMVSKGSGDSFVPSPDWTTELKDTKELTKLLKEGRQEIIFDMDDFLHDASSDWRNLNLV